MFCLIHVNPEDGRGKSVAAAVYDALRGTSLDRKFVVIGSDGTASMTGANRGAIRFMEEMISWPLQWAICLLHCNKLSLRHVSVELDGSTVGPNAFSSPIGKSLVGPASYWKVIKFQPVPHPTFPALPQPLLEDFSSDSVISTEFVGQ